MTDDRTLERAARSWIEAGPTRAPEEAVEAALLRIQATPQERDWLPWRFPKMLTPTRVALAAVIGVLVVGAAFLTSDRLRPPAVGSPDATSSPSPTISPSPSTPTPEAMPQILRGDWQAEVTEPLPNVANPGEAIQLSLDWQTGASAWIQPPRGDNVYETTSVEAADGELALLEGGSFVGCAPGGIGRYGWERSADGMFLTLTTISDDCSGRAAAYARTWVHSLSAVTDGGMGVAPFAGRWLQATIPSMRWGLGGATDAYDLTTFDEGDPAIRFLVVRNPMGFEDPCATGTRTPVPIERTTTRVVDYARGLPGVTVTTEDGQVAGLPAVHLTIDSAATDCPSGTIAAFHPTLAVEDGEWGFSPGGSHSMWVVEDGADMLLIWYEGEGVTPADEQSVIDSISFLDELPTP
jgi:hypothetical protein